MADVFTFYALPLRDAYRRRAHPALEAGVATLRDAIAALRLEAVPGALAALVAGQADMAAALRDAAAAGHAEARPDVPAEFERGRCAWRPPLPRSRCSPAPARQRHGPVRQLAGRVGPPRPAAARRVAHRARRRASLVLTVPCTIHVHVHVCIQIIIYPYMHHVPRL